MNCRRVSSLISAYIDGELTGVEMLEIRRHLEECRSCTLQYESLRNVKQLLSGLAYAKPRAGLADRISRRLDEVAVPGYMKLWNRALAFTHARLTPVAAGCVALGTVLVVLVSGPTVQPQLALSTPHPALQASSIQLPSFLTNNNVSPASVSEDRHTGIIPEQQPAQNDSGIFCLTSFDYSSR
ncbi:MAG: zf-HC2 domain-containing protein [Armatimonadota bacterium]